uniref:Rho GTPase activating protein 21 n=1 Tax=Scophthalmus maximus TaxID=52904 RepID=A0A8D3A0L1_SCOMX
MSSFLSCSTSRASNVHVPMSDLPVFFVSSAQAKQKDGRDQSEASAPTSPGPEEEPFSWPGPKTLHLRRTSQGFGFTLRHFIVYPPESAVHNSLKDEENGSRGRQRNRLEPMDTIFVKQVKEGGPAHGAGLCTGDRIVKVNGESIIGKTYSQVIALIQNSDASLELCVMPKDEDILQLAYSQDAYLKGNEAYSGNAQHIPEPPPICYPRIEVKAAGAAQSPEPAAVGETPRGPAQGPGRNGGTPEKSYRVEIPVPPSPPPQQTSKSQTVVCVCSENMRTVAMPPDPVDRGPWVARAGPSHRTEENRQVYSPSSSSRPVAIYADPLSSPAARAPVTAASPDTFSTAVSPNANRCSPSPTAPTTSPHQNIDWRNYTTYKDYIDAKRLHTYGCRTIQERLDSLRAAANSSSAYAQQRTPPPSSAGQRGAPGSQVRQRSTSNDRGVDARSQGTAVTTPLRSVSQERLGGGTERTVSTRNWPRSASQDALPYSTPTGVAKPRARSCDYLGRQPAEAGEVDGADFEDRLLLCRQEEPRASRQSHWTGGRRARESGLSNSAPAFTKGTTDSVITSRTDGVIMRPSRLPVKNSLSDSSPALPTNRTTDPLKDQRAAVMGNHLGYSSPLHLQLRGRADSLKMEKAPHIRPPSYILAVNDNNDARVIHKSRLGDTRHKSGSNNLNDSLDSIPFIDEPSSASIDLDSADIPASALISGAPIIITTIPPSPTSPCPLMRRQMSHDQDSLRLTIIESDSGTKTERSKSYDEGLDNYREEGRGSSEDSGSRRDSSSDVFCDATKEGLLHFKQLNTDKGKRGGGGSRPWKQMYAVLRGNYLCLYKDKKEGQAHANCQAVDEPLPISIKACLIDISYSDTKRKNVLRLTTSDREYLFQAEDREDMLAWIRVIQENGNLDEENAAFTSHDLISRKIKEYNTLMRCLVITECLLTVNCYRYIQTLFRTVRADDTSPPKDKGTWRKGIPGLMRKPFERKPSPGVTFGVRLDDCPAAQTNKFVPLIVEVCCQLVEERGLEYTGIYRVPGNNAAISNMQEELNNKGMNDIDIQDDKWRDLNVISSLLKSFFRKLPEPLFTNDRYTDFIDANRIEGPVERLKVIKRLLHELPDHHYETLKFLSAHLKTVADNSEKNKMEPRNLAIVFGPTLVRTTEDNMTHMVTHMPDQYKIVETLIQNYEWFFTEDGNGEPVTVSRYESAVESQPLPNIDHLLTNIGRTATSQGEVSGNALPRGSWGSGKDQCSRELLVSSIFAAASRKRKKSKEKPQPSSSDDDLDAVFAKKEIPGQKPNHHHHPQLLQTEVQSETRPGLGAKQQARSEERKENGRTAELTPKAKREHRNSMFLKETQARHAPPSPSPIVSYQAAPQGKSSLSDPPSQLDENTSDLGTMSSRASVPRSRPKKWMAGDLPAEVSSITSDYSTTSSITFLTGAESSALSPELQGGEEADDERSELISEGRPMETDSESDFPVFAPGGGSSQSTPRAEQSQDKTEARSGSAAEGGATPKLEARRLFPSHRMIECDTLSRRWSLRQKTDSESSVEGVAASGERGGGRTESSTRLSRVLEVMKKGRSTSSLSSSSRSESERPEPAAWHLKITERLKFRIRTSADDMFTQKSRAPDARGKKKSIRRRHTMGGQRDFAELAVINDWREQGGVETAADLSSLDNVKPRCSSEDWISRERCVEVAPRAVPEDDHAEARDVAPSVIPPPSTDAPPPPPPPPGEHVNGSGPQGKNKASLGADAHPHKLSGAQVVRSRFYQYL